MGRKFLSIDIRIKIGFEVKFYRKSRELLVLDDRVNKRKKNPDGNPDFEGKLNAQLGLNRPLIVDSGVIGSIMFRLNWRVSRCYYVLVFIIKQRWIQWPEPLIEIRILKKSILN